MASWTWEIEVGGSQAGVQPGLHSEILSRRKAASSMGQGAQTGRRPDHLVVPVCVLFTVCYPQSTVV